MESRVSKTALRSSSLATVLVDDAALTLMSRVRCMTHFLDVGDLVPLIRSHDAQQALLLARVFVVHQTGRLAIEVGHLS